MELNRASLIVLVAEDEALIGMTMEDALTQAGYTVAGVFPTSTAALEWLEDRHADAAVLDVHLRDGDCVELLRELKARAVPLLLYSAFSRVPDEFRDLPRVMKPWPIGEVVKALDGLLLGEHSATSTSPAKGAVDRADDAIPASSEPKR
jgi:DNA-binding response OmpR family regulator